MSLHDAFARITPYELSFPDLEFARSHFQAIQSEAEARSADLRDPSGFVMLAAAGEALRAIRGPEDDPALIKQYGSMLYHAFHFFAAGEPLYLIEAAVLRDLTRRDPVDPDWTPGLEPPAGYAQLPQHMVWVRAEADAPPESLDGFFWTRSGDDRIELLLALGMRGDRPGLSVVSLAELPLGDVAGWSALAMREGGREGGEDFASTMPGAELERLIEIRSVGEALKLAARVLWRVERGPVPAPVAPREATSGTPRASALAYRRVAAVEAVT